MTPEEAAKRIAVLIRAGYLAQAGRYVPTPNGGEVPVFLQDEFVVTSPEGNTGRPTVLSALAEEMGW